MPFHPLFDAAVGRKDAQFIDRTPPSKIFYGHITLKRTIYPGTYFENQAPNQIDPARSPTGRTHNLAEQDIETLTNGTVIVRTPHQPRIGEPIKANYYRFEVYDKKPVRSP